MRMWMSFSYFVSAFEDEVSTPTRRRSDRVTILAISILAISGDPVATARGTDSMHVTPYGVKPVSAGAGAIRTSVAVRPLEALSSSSVPCQKCMAA